MNGKYLEFSDLLGKTITHIEGAEKGSDCIKLTTSDGDRFQLWHSQDCCETVDVDDVNGDVADLIGLPLTLAEESTSNTNPEGVQIEYQDSFTWTFYRLGTTKGVVVLRWYGASNGYYSESVNFEKLT